MKKRSLIILLVAVLVGLVVIGAGTTYAWLTQEDENVITYEVGEINYGITLEGQVPNLVVPGQPLTPTFTITNNSNIDTNLRALVSIKSYKDKAGNTGAVVSKTTNSSKVIVDKIQPTCSAEGLNRTTTTEKVKFTWYDNNSGVREVVKPNGTRQST